MDKVKPLTFDDQNFIREVFEQHPPVFSEFTFSNLYMWNSSRPTFLCEIEGTIIFLIQDAAKTFQIFGPPFGMLNLDQIIPKLPVEVTKAVRTCLPAENIPGWTFETSPNDADYVYRVSDLVDLPGPLYQKKRQLVRGCLSRYECQYEELQEKNLQECGELQEKVYEEGSRDKGAALEHEAAKRLLEKFDQFDVFGGAIRINRRIEGFMIGKKLNPNTAVGHVEKTNLKIHGLSELLHHWFAKYALEGFEYFNVEQDLGIKGLREAKSRFHPDHMVVKWTGQFKQSRHSL